MASATVRMDPAGRKMPGIAGLPAQYIVQQMADFKSGARTTSVPQRVPSQLMIKSAKGITDAEIEQAAAYFSGLRPRAAIKVVETPTVPKTIVAGWFLAALPGGETESTGGRIIEVHGPELNGLGPIPDLAGRSPSYLVRQLYDFQHGTRAGPWSPADGA